MATTATNLTDAAGPGAGFYRLRFLAPTITVQPQGQTNSTGSNVTINVTATGTTPLAYQWRKDNSPLAGKTDAALDLRNLITNEVLSKPAQTPREGTRPTRFRPKTSICRPAALSGQGFERTSNDAGNYSTFITNRVGGATSIVAELSVTNPLSRPFGIYMGTFAGQLDSGGFALMGSFQRAGLRRRV